MSTPRRPRLRGLLSCSCLVFTALFATPALAGDFLDTRITFTIGDDDFLRDAGETVPDTPRLSIGDRPGYELSFDNLNLRNSGRENQLHLVLYKKVEGLLPRLITEAAATLEFNLVKGTFFDDSSYIRLAYALDPEARGKEYIDLVLFPIDGDRFRAGYLYDLTWGGSSIFPERFKVGLTPGFKLGGNHGRWYWWAGSKIVLLETATEESRNEQEQRIESSDTEAFYSALAGVGVKPLEGLSIDLSAAYMQLGENPIQDVKGELVTTQGFSARVAYARGLNVGLSADLRLVRNDREYLEALSRRPTYKPGSGLSWRVSLEGSLVSQVLADPDLFGGTKLQWAPAAALDARLQWDYLRVNLTVLYRSLEFMLLNTPSLVPFTGLSQDAIVAPQFFVALAADYHFPKVGLTPGLQLGFEMPAAVKSELYADAVGDSAPPTLIGVVTQLFRPSGDRVILPETEEELPIFSVRASLDWWTSSFLTVRGFVFMQYDPNATILEIDADFTATRVFDTAVRLGAAVQAQARF